MAGRGALLLTFLVLVACLGGVSAFTNPEDGMLLCPDHATHGVDPGCSGSSCNCQKSRRWIRAVRGIIEDSMGW